jgi:hypothetical protein
MDETVGRSKICKRWPQAFCYSVGKTNKAATRGLERTPCRFRKWYETNSAVCLFSHTACLFDTREQIIQSKCRTKQSPLFKRVNKCKRVVQKQTRSDFAFPATFTFSCYLK